MILVGSQSEEITFNLVRTKIGKIDDNKLALEDVRRIILLQLRYKCVNGNKDYKNVKSAVIEFIVLRSNTSLIMNTP